MVANTISISLSEMISGCESTKRITAAANQNAFVEATLGAFALPGKSGQIVRRPAPARTMDTEHRPYGGRRSQSVNAMR